MGRPFYLWSVFAAVVWVGGSRLAEAVSQIPNAGLRDAVQFLFALVDPVWFGLAAATVYLSTVQTHGHATVRRWAVILLIGVALLITANAASTWPLGPILYTRHLGIRLWGTPVALALFWFSILLGGRDLLSRFLPRASHRSLALGTGALASLTELLLEPLAQQDRTLWFWYDPATRAPAGAPWQNYLIWFLAGTGLTFALRDRSAVGGASTGRFGSRFVWMTFHIVFLTTQLRRLILG